jgi:hypothetical protein
MKLFLRCFICKGIIWPWQWFGYRTVASGRITWHSPCHRALLERWDADKAYFMRQAELRWKEEDRL